MINLNGVETLYYGYADNQGSPIVLTDINGNWVEKYAYDPWGARRNPDDWRQKDMRSSWLSNRGYTGHEHLDLFNIINMNGRVYDSLTAMFFSPGWNFTTDEFVVGVSMATSFNSNVGATMNVNGTFAKGVGIVVGGGAVYLTGGAIFATASELTFVFGF